MKQIIIVLLVLISSSVFAQHWKTEMVNKTYKQLKKEHKKTVGSLNHDIKSILYSRAIVLVNEAEKKYNKRRLLVMEYRENLNCNHRQRYSLQSHQPSTVIIPKRAVMYDTRYPLNKVIIEYNR